MMTRNRSAKPLSENMFRLVTAKFGLAVIVINCQLKAIETITNLWNVAVLNRRSTYYVSDNDLVK